MVTYLLLSNYRINLTFSRLVLPPLPVQEPANPLIEIIAGLDNAGQFLDNCVKLFSSQIYFDHRKPKRRDNQISLLSRSSPIKRHRPRPVDIRFIQLDARVEAYELPPDRVPGDLQRRPLGEVLMPSPEKQAASGAIDRVGVGFVAANDAIVGRLLPEAEVLDLWGWRAWILLLWVL